MADYDGDDEVAQISSFKAHRGSYSASNVPLPNKKQFKEQITWCVSGQAFSRQRSERPNHCGCASALHYIYRLYFIFAGNMFVHAPL